jgi:hypothetical protein
MSNQCTACGHLFEGHVSCPNCGHSGYRDLDSLAGLVIRGNTFAHKEAIKACGAEWDGKEWFVPTGLSPEQSSNLYTLIANRESMGLQCGFYA